MESKAPMTKTIITSNNHYIYDEKYISLLIQVTITP